MFFLGLRIGNWGEGGAANADGYSGIVGFLSVVCVREYSVWKRGGNANVDVEAGVEGDYKAGDTV